jgi:hypothetical protein
MNSRIYLIDSYANSIDSIAHRASYIIKMLFTTLLLIAIISTKSYTKIGFVYINSDCTHTYSETAACDNA